MNKETISVLAGWAMLAGAYMFGKKRGKEQAVVKFKDAMLKGYIEKDEKEAKEAKGS